MGLKSCDSALSAGTNPKPSFYRQILPFQMVFWLLLVGAWLLPVPFFTGLYYGLGNMHLTPTGLCLVEFTQAVYMAIESTYSLLPCLIMMTFTIIFLTMIGCRWGKRLPDQSVSGAYVAAVVCSIAATCLSLFGGGVFLAQGLVSSYHLWIVRSFLMNLIPGVTCLIWVLCSRDLRSAALCQSAATGEKSMLLPK